MYELGKPLYTFTNRCHEVDNLELGDGTTKVIVNTKGARDSISPELAGLLDYFEGKEPTTDLTKRMDEAVKHIRNNEKWRREYMRFAEIEKERFDEGVAKGIEIGEARGEARGKNVGAIAIIELCAELQMQDEEIIKKLIEKLKITEEEAKKYMADNRNE